MRPMVEASRPDAAAIDIDGAIFEFVPDSKRVPGWRASPWQADMDWPDRSGVRSRVEQFGKRIFWSSPGQVEKRLSEGCELIIRSDVSGRGRQCIALSDGMVLMARPRSRPGDPDPVPRVERRRYSIVKGVFGLAFLSSAAYLLVTGKATLFYFGLSTGSAEIESRAWRHGLGVYMVLCGAYLLFQPRLFARAKKGRADEDAESSLSSRDVYATLVAILLMGLGLVFLFAVPFLPYGPGKIHDYGQSIFYLLVMFIVIIPFLPSVFNVLAWLFGRIAGGGRRRPRP